MPAISFSGMLTLTFSLRMLSMLTTGWEGRAVSPALRNFLPTTPSMGAWMLQSSSIFLAAESEASACSTLLCTSTHFMSASDLFSCSFLMRSRASVACLCVACAMARAFSAWVLSISASSWPLRTWLPSLTCTCLIMPMPVKLTATDVPSSTTPT